MDQLTDINGIGSTAVDRLKKCGITTVDQLSNSKIDDLVKIKGIGKKSAESWISDAKKLIDNQADTKENTRPESIETSEPKKIPRFLFKRLSKKARKIMEMSLTKLRNTKLKKLKKYHKRLYPERLKFDPSLKDEKMMIEEINEKERLIDEIIINYKENKAKEIVDHYIDPILKNGNFRNSFQKFDETTFYSDQLPVEKVRKMYANWLFDQLPNKASKKYPFSDANFVRKIIKKLKVEKTADVFTKKNSKHA